MPLCSNCRASMGVEGLKHWTDVMHQACPGWRLGQTAFNVVYDIHPDVANKIRTSPLDPFNDDEVLDAFWAKVGELLTPH